MEEEKYRLNQDLNARVINKANVTYLRKTVFLLFIIFTILSLLSIVLLVLSIINNDTTFIVLGGVALGVTILVDLVYLLLPVFFTRKNINTLSFHYSFYDDKMVINLRTDQLNGHEERKYKDLPPYIETKEFFYIMVNKSQFYTIIKDDESEEIINFLKRKIKKR